MNKHIELVKKWLDDPSSVTVRELKENAKAAAVYDAAAYATNAADTFAAAFAAYDAAVRAAYDADAADAEHYVEKYEEITGRV